jgi:hypothetical protein
MSGAADVEQDSAMSDASQDAEASTSSTANPQPVGPLCVREQGTRLEELSRRRCNFGPRLAFTYFKDSPEAEDLNARSDTCHFFTIDAALVRPVRLPMGADGSAAGLPVVLPGLGAGKWPRFTAKSHRAALGYS